MSGAMFSLCSENAMIMLLQVIVVICILYGLNI